LRDSPSTAVAEPPAPARLAFARVNPLECGEEIKQLFLAHDRPEFPAFFDRTYADAVRDGASSWIGRDPDGRLCAHLAQFPRPFRYGSRVVRGSLLANLMVAAEHRRLWPAVALVRHLVNALRESGAVDLLYGDPNAAALAVVRAVGFRSIGALQRSILPLRDVRPHVDLSIRLYHRIGRFRVTTTSLVMTAQRAADLPDGPQVALPSGDDPVLHPEPQPSLYRHRLAGYPSASDVWYTFRHSASESPVGAMLVRGPDSHGIAVVSALFYESLTLVSSMLVSLAGALRDAGMMKLELSVMAESQLAAEAGRAGFVLREERIPVVALSLTPLGAEAMGVGAEWRLLPVDLDR